jgi:hypothetical protein
MFTHADTDRRAHERFPVRIEMTARRGDRVIACTSEDLSLGGAKLKAEEHHDLRPGERLQLSFQLPGQRRTLEVEGEVRWKGRDHKYFGIEFGRGIRATLAAFFATLAVASPQMVSATSAVPTFDPNADMSLGEGSGQRPDEFTLLQAFEQQFGAFDRCVDAAKHEADRTLDGNAKMQILLNPAGKRPLGVNAEMPKKHKKKAKLRECLRQAAAQAPFPRYDGPPIVVDFEFQLDAGYTYEED